MKHLDLFSGIGGFALAVEAVWPEAVHEFCEIDPFCRAILGKHWPQAVIHEDIKILRPGSADIVTGGFPCQPFSAAGKRRGKEDDRHLWPEMLRVIRLSSPEWVVAENVGGLLTWNRGMVLDEVYTDLEAAGYEVWAFVVPACAVGAPHRRDRVWIVAHYEGERRQQIPNLGGEKNIDAYGQDRTASDAGRARRRQDIRDAPCDEGAHERWPAQDDHVACGVGADISADSIGNGQQRVGAKRNTSGSARLQDRKNAIWSEDWPAAAARLCTVDDGLSDGLARPRGWRNAALKGAGNAIVPQVAEEIMKAIKQLKS